MLFSELVQKCKRVESWQWQCVWTLRQKSRISVRKYWSHSPTLYTERGRRTDTQQKHCRCGSSWLTPDILVSIILLTDSYFWELCLVWLFFSFWHNRASLLVLQDRFSNAANSLFFLTERCSLHLVNRSERCSKWYCCNQSHFVCSDGLTVNVALLSLFLLL